MRQQAKRIDDSMLQNCVRAHAHLMQAATLVTPLLGFPDAFVQPRRGRCVCMPVTPWCAAKPARTLFACAWRSFRALTRYCLWRLDPLRSNTGTVSKA